MKYIKYLLIFILGCGADSVTNFEPETFNLEIKEWGRRATNNNASGYSPWNGLAGMQVGHSIRNNHKVDLKIEYVLNIRGARLQSDIGSLISIDKSPPISSTVGLLCENTNVNLNPINIIASNTIKPGQHLFAIAFAEVNWDEWFSVYSTVTINSNTFELFKSVNREIIIVKPEDYGFDTNFTLPKIVMDDLGAEGFLLRNVTGSHHYQGEPLDNLIFEFTDTKAAIEYILRFEDERLSELPENTILEVYSPENEDGPDESWLYYIEGVKQ